MISTKLTTRDETTIELKEAPGHVARVDVTINKKTGPSTTFALSHDDVFDFLKLLKLFV